MPDGTQIQIEDWSEDYNCYAPAETVAAYPISKKTIYKKNSIGYPREGKKFRASFNFGTAKVAKEAFETLIAGTSSLKDFSAYMHDPQYGECL